MLGEIQCLGQAYGKGFLRGCLRARVASRQAKGLGSSKCTHHARQGCGDIPYRAPSADGEASRTKGSRVSSSLTRAKADGIAGRVQRGDGDGGEEGRDLVQEHCDRAGRRQREEQTVVVLLDLGGHFAGMIRPKARVC
jgi:hypothetical protein